MGAVRGPGEALPHEAPTTGVQHGGDKEKRVSERPGLARGPPPAPAGRPVSASPATTRPGPAPPGPTLPQPPRAEPHSSLAGNQRQCLDPGMAPTSPAPPGEPPRAGTAQEPRQPSCGPRLRRGCTGWKCAPPAQAEQKDGATGSPEASAPLHPPRSGGCRRGYLREGKRHQGPTDHNEVQNVPQVPEVGPRVQQQAQVNHLQEAGGSGGYTGEGQGRPSLGWGRRPRS